MEREKTKYKYTSGKINTSKQTAEQNSILFWILSILTLIFLLWAPFQKGLFNGNTFDFERPIYSSVIWSSIILFLLAFFCFYRWKLNTNVDLIIIAIWLIPLSFAVSSFSSASYYFSHNMIYIQLIYITFFILGVLLCRGNLGASIIINGLMTVGYVIVWFGIMNWLGNKEVAFRLVKWFASNMSGLNYYRDAVMTDSVNVRLTSVFQYANAYASYLIVLMITSIYLISLSKKWYIILFHSVSVVPIMISFLITLSRGALVILPIIILLIFLCLKPYRQLMLIIYFVISGSLTFVILEKFTDIGVEQLKQFNGNLSFTGWKLLICVSIVFIILSIILQKYIAPVLEAKITQFNNKQFSNVILPFVAVIVGLVAFYLLFANSGFLNLLPDNLKNRVETINFEQNSVLERGTFYKDAFKLFQDYPVLGAGGGAWAALYEKYQNNPYVSRQAHNFFLQYLVEAGLVGFLIFILIIGSIYFFYLRDKFQNKTENNRFVFFIIATSLLVHSLIDFDLSYIYLGIVLFIALGGMISSLSIKKVNEGWKNLSKIRWINPSVVVIISLVMFFNSTQLLSANSNFMAALSAAQNQKSINEIFVPLDNALKIRPNHPDYVSYKADLLLQGFTQTKDDKFYNEALTLIQQTRTKEPTNRGLIEKQIYALAIKDQLPAALDLVNKEIPNFPWDITLYEKNILMNFDLGSRASDAKDSAAAKTYWDQALATYNTIIEKSKQLESLPKGQLQGREFGLTKNIAFTLGQIDYMFGKYGSAESFLKFQLTDQFDDQMNTEMAKWYLASLQKQNKNDQALYDKLIAKHPEEKDEINKLVNATFSVK